jgi:hypothetical protein
MPIVPLEKAKRSLMGRFVSWLHGLDEVEAKGDGFEGHPRIRRVCPVFAVVLVVSFTIAAIQVLISFH